MNLSIPLDLSINLSHKVLEMRSAGIDTTKASLILKYTQQGLSMDNDGISEPISNPGINDNDGGKEVR
jgi:hypothetical protein